MDGKLAYIWNRLNVKRIEKSHIQLEGKVSLSSNNLLSSSYALSTTSKLSSMSWLKFDRHHRQRWGKMTPKKKMNKYKTRYRLMHLNRFVRELSRCTTGCVLSSLFLVSCWLMLMCSAGHHLMPHFLLFFLLPLSALLFYTLVTIVDAMVIFFVYDRCLFSFLLT